MRYPTEAEIRRTLAALKGKALNVTGLTLKPEGQGVHVSFALEVDPREAGRFEPLRQAAAQAVAGLEGVTGVTAVLTAHRAPPPAVPRGAGQKILLEGVKHVIAVASGKGGVGKSTTAVNLAVALTLLGQKTGLLDADIYGPSIPRLLGLQGQPPINEEKKMLPMAQHGLKVMSIGFLVPEDAPIVWRGPMVHGALVQMLRDVAWGELDILVIDMPPGTGDAQLTLAQQAPLNGAVIVSTPQDIALLDARKGVGMFGKVNVPILGIVENMSFFLCPHCGGRSDIFSHGGAEHEAQKLEVPFLGAVPLELGVRETSDAGTPVVLAQPDSTAAHAYQGIAEKVLKALKAY